MRETIDVEKLREGVREMGKALARARGFDPSEFRFTVPGWYSCIDSRLCGLFSNDPFWGEVARREGTTRELLDTDLAEN